MDQIKLAEGSLQLLRKDFGLKEDIDLKDAVDPFERLVEYLELVVKSLLDHDFAHLINKLYVMDIDEEQLKQVLTLSDPDRLSREISLLIVNREKDKLLTRAKYAETNNCDKELFD